MFAEKTTMEKEPTVLKYIDPMVDFGFKKIFKESGNKQFIIRPLRQAEGGVHPGDEEHLGLQQFP